MKEELYYFCSNCDTSFASKTKIDRCPICNSNISELEKNYDYSTYYFGTFKKNIEEARKEYKIKINNLFIPFAFKKKEVLNNICKAYIPCLFLNTHIDGNILFYGKDKKSNEEFKNSVKVNIDYRNEFLSLNKMISTYVINQISDTFQYDKYDSIKVEDFIILDNNVDSDKDIDKYHEELINTSVVKAREKVPHKLKKVVEKKLNINDISKSIVYLPIYFTSVNYKKKKYYFIMNGEDGKVYFNIVPSKRIIIVFGLVLFLIIFLILFFLTKMF